MRLGAVPPDASRSRSRGRRSTPHSSGVLHGYGMRGRIDKAHCHPDEKSDDDRGDRQRTDHPSPCSSDRAKRSRSERRESRGGVEEERSDVVVRVARHRGPPGALIGAFEHPAQRGSERSPDGIARPTRSRPLAGPRSSGGRWLRAGVAEADRERRRRYGDRPSGVLDLGSARVGSHERGIPVRRLDAGSGSSQGSPRSGGGRRRTSWDPAGARGARPRGRTHPGRCPRLPHGFL